MNDTYTFKYDSFDNEKYLFKSNKRSNVYIGISIMNNQVDQVRYITEPDVDEECTLLSYDENGMTMRIRPKRIELPVMNVQLVGNIPQEVLDALQNVHRYSCEEKISDRLRFY